MPTDVTFAQLLALVAQFGGCQGCGEVHGSYPESVSCYCACHDGAEARWPTLKRLALAALPPRPPRG